MVSPQTIDTGEPETRGDSKVNGSSAASVGGSERLEGENGVSSYEDSKVEDTVESESHLVGSGKAVGKAVGNDSGSGQFEGGKNELGPLESEIGMAVQDLETSGALEVPDSSIDSGSESKVLENEVSGEQEKETDNESSSEVGQSQLENVSESKGPTSESNVQVIESDTQVTEFNDLSLNHDDYNRSDRESISSSSSSSSSSSTTSSSSSISMPPPLKYSRLKGLPKAFFSRDPVSACLVSETFMAFATHSGVLHLCRPDMTPMRTFRAHRASVLSISTNGEYFITASMDGSVIIGLIENQDDIARFDFKRPVHCAVLDRNYRHTRRFVLGGTAGQVLLSLKNWMNVRSDVVIHKGSGPIVGLHYLDDVIFWASESGLCVYNVPSGTMLLKIPRPPGAPRADLYWPRFVTLERDRVAICWVDRVYHVRVTTGASRGFLLGAASLRSTAPERTASLEREAVLEEALIAGIAPFANDLMLVLTYSAPKSEGTERPKAGPPEVRIVGHQGEELADDVVAMEGYENLGLNDYQLATGNGKYYLVSAHDAVVVEPFGLKDRFDWFEERSRYREAWEIAGHLISWKERVEVGLKAVDQELEAGSSESLNIDTAVFLEKVLDEGLQNEVEETSKLDSDEQSKSSEATSFISQKWNEYASKFIALGRAELLSTILPSKPELGIPPSIYESVLAHLLEIDRAEYAKVVLRWSTRLYDIHHVERLLEEKIEQENDPELRRVLSSMYLESGDPVLAVSHLIALRSPQVYSVISQYHVLLRFLDQLPGIVTMQVTKEEIQNPTKECEKRLAPAVDMLIKNVFEASPDKVVEKLESLGLHFVTYLYLDRLEKLGTESSVLEGFEDLQIELLARYNQKKLLYFLVNKRHYSIDRAIALFEKDDKFVKELIYLLGKIGKNSRALNLIIEKVGDPQEAISFVKSKTKNGTDGDRELLRFLVDTSVDKPSFIAALIETANDLIDPMELVRKIPENTRIENLQASLTNIILNNTLNVMLNENILKIVNSETVGNYALFDALNERGFLVDAREAQDVVSELRRRHPHGFGALLKPLVDFGTHEEVFKGENREFKDAIKGVEGGALVSEADIVGEGIWRGVVKDLGGVLRHLGIIREKVKSVRGY